MNKFNVVLSKYGRGLRGSGRAILVVALSVFLSGCYFTAAIRDYQSGAKTPWWCEGTTDLDQQECFLFSLQMDVAIKNTFPYPTLADFTAAGAYELTERPAGIGVAYTTGTVGTPAFAAGQPNVLLYDGTSPSSRLVGVAWALNPGGSAPQGFAGSNDVWTYVESAVPGNGSWWLTAWIVRGYQNHLNVFATSHPCLTSSGSILTSTTDACFIAAHTEPFEVLVTNDDGYSEAGIDAIVEGLYALPNVTVHVVAPLLEQSGSGSSTTPEGYTVAGVAAVTASSKPATAVTSTFTAAPRHGSGSPADSVLYALSPDELSLSPEIVISGINAGQNFGLLSSASGTVGAARTARRNGVPAIATSQGNLSPPHDYPAGVAETLDLLEDWRLGRTTNTNASVLSINIPTCPTGSVRGRVNTIVSQDAIGSRDYFGQNCESTQTVIIDDIDAFNNGFAGVTDVGVSKPPNWP